MEDSDEYDKKEIWIISFGGKSDKENSRIGYVQRTDHYYLLIGL